MKFKKELISESLSDTEEFDLDGLVDEVFHSFNMFRDELNTLVYRSKEIVDKDHTGYIKDLCDDADSLIGMLEDSDDEVVKYLNYIRKDLRRYYEEKDNFEGEEQ